MSYTNTSKNQDADIKQAEDFASDQTDLSDEISTHISELVSIISDLDDKIEEAKKLLDDNEIPHNI